MAWTKEKQRAYYIKWFAKNKHRVRASHARWRAANRETARARVAKFNKLKGKEYTAKYRARHPDRRAATCARYRAANLDAERTRTKAYRLANKPKLAAKAAARRAMVLQATPPWVDYDRVAAIYADAARITKETGVPHEVDHIYPLKGRDGSRGLHTHENLRILPARANRAKGNRPPEFN
jgi:hypothetical protein